MRFLLFSLLFFSLASPGLAVGGGAPGPLRDHRHYPAVRLAAVRSLRAFVARLPGEVRVQRARGAPSSLRGGPAPGLDLAQELAASLATGLELQLEQRLPGHRRYGLRFRGVRVFPDVLTLSEGRGGWMLAGTLPDSEQVALRGRLTEEEARSRALALVGVRRHDGVSIEPVLFDTGDRGLRAAHLVEIRSLEPPGHLQVVVDALSGAVPYLDDLSSHLGSVPEAASPEPSGQEYQGVAGVYPTHPDDGPLQELPIDRMTRSGRLRGTEVVVSNDDEREAYGKDQRFVYPPSSKHLDEAMVYFHVNRTNSFFRSLGELGAVARPLAAGVYYGENYDNAMFLSWAPALVFGDGYRYHPLSREAAVVIHEYTHAVTYGLTQMGSMGAAGAMNEAFSDYFAAVLTGDPVIGEYVVSPTGRPYMRTLVNDLQFPGDLTGESHDDSRIFSGALWKLRGALGAVADPLVHRCRPYLNRESGFPEGLAALLQADQELHEGVHAAAIRDAFRRHGIEEGGVQW